MQVDEDFGAATGVVPTLTDSFHPEPEPEFEPVAAADDRALARTANSDSDGRRTGDLAAGSEAG